MFAHRIGEIWCSVSHERRHAHWTRWSRPASNLRDTNPERPVEAEFRPGSSGGCGIHSRRQFRVRLPSPAHLIFTTGGTVAPCVAASPPGPHTMRRRGKALKRPHGAYYSARDGHSDEELCRVGHGTPCGEYLRRFWQPVCVEAELEDLPRAIRILGEDLVVLRDGGGRVGLLDRRCVHRGTSLEFGKVQERGIRCCYHGWHFDIDGTILDTPGEPPDSSIRHRLCHGAYPVEVWRGLVFAYMGPPEEYPPFPVFDAFEHSEAAGVLQPADMRCWGSIGVVGVVHQGRSATRNLSTPSSQGVGQSLPPGGRACGAASHTSVHTVARYPAHTRVARAIQRTGSGLRPPPHPRNEVDRRRSVPGGLSGLSESMGPRARGGTLPPRSGSGADACFS